MPALIGLLSVSSVVGFFVTALVFKNPGLSTVFVGMFVLSTVLSVVHLLTRRRPTVGAPEAAAKVSSSPRLDLRQVALEEVLKLHPEMGRDLSSEGIQALNNAVEARMPEVDLKIRLDEIHARERETQRSEEARRLAREKAESQRLSREQAESERRAQEAQRAKAVQDHLASLSPRRRFVSKHRVSLLSAAIGAVLVVVVVGVATYNSWLERTAEAEAILAEEQWRSDLVSSCDPQRINEIPQDLRQSVFVKWASCTSTEGKILLASASRSEDFDVLRTLAKDVEPLVRAAVAANVNIPMELSIELAADPDARVCGSVVNDTRPFAEELAQELSSCGDWKQRETSAFFSQSADLLAELARDSEIEVRRTVAANRRTNELSLSLLAEDPSQAVRLAVAQNPNTEPKVLAALANDEVEMVRTASIQAIKGYVFPEEVRYQ
jgi:hypothetical protein